MSAAVLCQGDREAVSEIQTPGELLGARVRELRQKRKLTQGDLSARCGLPQSRISEIEKGARVPNLVTILRLAVALDCKASALISVFDRPDLASLL
jgi:transcriptional regulator with XRE-family HTH domain